MSPRTVRVGFGVALGVSLALAPLVTAADEKPSQSEKPPKLELPKPPDWSGYVTVADVVGEIVQADDKKMTLRVTWYAPQVQRTGGGNNRNNNYRRPNLSGNNRNYRNPYAQNRNRPPQVKVTYKEEHHDYDLEFVPESLIRTKTLPRQLDLNGKPLKLTKDELALMRAPANYPGYAADRKALVPGSIVEVFLVRDRSIPPARATENDLRVKYAVILGLDPTPPKSDSKKK
jgi:hypothetical protein